MRRIFISSTNSEMRIAHELAHRLKLEGLSPIVDSFEAQFADEWLNHILYSVESSDVVLLLMPEDDYKSKWLRREINKNLEYKIKSRNIFIIHVYLGGDNTYSYPSDQVRFTLRDESPRMGIKEYSEVSIQKLVGYLTYVPKVDFEILSQDEFEDLIISLLRKLRFFKIEKQKLPPDMGFDILAKTKKINTPGGTRIINWAIEIKYNKSSRADIRSLKNLSSYLENRSMDVNGLLITNGQLTSTALEWLEYYEKGSRKSISVVDGVQLKQLILKHPEIVDEFFGHRGDL